MIVDNRSILYPTNKYEKETIYLEILTVLSILAKVITSHRRTFYIAWMDLSLVAIWNIIL